VCYYPTQNRLHTEKQLFSTRRFPVIRGSSRYKKQKIFYAVEKTPNIVSSKTLIIGDKILNFVLT